MTIQNDILKHQVFLERFSRQLAKRYKTSFSKISKRIKTKLDVMSPLTALQIRQFIKDELFTTSVKTLKELEQLAQYEAEFNTKLVKKHINKNAVQPVIDNAIQADIKTTLNKGSISTLQAINSFENKKLDEYDSLMTQQMIDDDGTTVKERVEEKSQGIDTTQALVLMGLATLAISSHSFKEVAKVNNIQKVRWVSVLEDNTCPTCESLHGEVYTIDNAPSFPQHSRCQCSLIYVEE